MPCPEMIADKKELTACELDAEVKRILNNVFSGDYSGLSLAPTISRPKL